jgi:hypothetical protein
MKKSYLLFDNGVDKVGDGGGQAGAGCGNGTEEAKWGEADHSGRKGFRRHLGDEEDGGKKKLAPFFFSFFCEPPPLL